MEVVIVELTVTICDTFTVDPFRVEVATVEPVRVEYVPELIAILDTVTLDVIFVDPISVEK